MAEENQDGQEKTEEPSDERREKFRTSGDVAVSRELTSVFVLASVTLFLSVYIGRKKTLKHSCCNRSNSLLNHVFLFQLSFHYR